MNNFIRFTPLILILIFLDQLTKTYLISYLKTRPYFILGITPFLDFVHAWNYGVSFGLFKQYYQYSNYALLILNSFIVLYLGNMLLKSASKLSSLGISFIIGGAIGNLIDRGARGAVFDFIYFNYGDLYFPAFNLADSFITIGASIFLWDYFLQKKSLAEK